MTIKLLLLLTGSSLFFATAENKGSGKKVVGGDEFRKAALEYRKKAVKSEKLAMYYKRLATIKMNAAILADQGKWDDISWDEYHEINKAIVELHGYSEKDKK